MDYQRVKLVPGDEIEVNGHRFVLVELKTPLYRPAQVVFATPAEELERIAKNRD